MTTSVPTIIQGATGWTAPTEAAILAGVQADINSAFGGGLNFPSTVPVAGTVAPPQVQLSVSEAAIVGNTNALLLALFNGFDPAYASGRMQDALGRIYFMTRIPATSTVVQCLCSGLPGVNIPLNALATDTAGNVYSCTEAGVIGVGGFVTLPFANNVQGPIPCPSGTLNQIYQAIPGWDSITNPLDGAEGNLVESRAAFETRRQQFVAAQSLNSVQSILGALLGVSNIVGAYVQDNFESYPIAVNPAAVITGSITGTSLTVSSVLTGTVAIGQVVSGPGMLPGTTITSGSSSPYTISPTQNVPSATLQLGGVQILANSIYACAAGGASLDIANAILSKKAPGCNMTGNTTVTAYDSSYPYVPPGIPYSITYENPPDVEIYFNVTILDSTSIPSNAAAQIQAAILNAFIGNDGGTRTQMGSLILASRFYPAVYNLGFQLLSLTLGSSASPAFTITASISTTTLTVTVTGGVLAVGQVLFLAGIVQGTQILEQTGGTPGSTGTYKLNNSQTLLSTAGIAVIAMTATSLQMLVNQMPVTSAGNINAVV
jgi:hypothetical protein